MKTIIQGHEFEGTPSELKEFLDLLAPKSTNNTGVSSEKKVSETEISTPTRTVCAATGQKSLNPTPKKRSGKNSFGRIGCPVYTISMVNGARVKYANQSLCARFLGVNEADISKRKDTGRPISGYYISTKEKV